MNIIDSPSPNFDDRAGQAIDMLVLHYTGMKSGANAIDRLRDPTAKVSAHYVIEEDGKIHRLVAEEMRAWHAGVSYWRGNTNINQRSIGIEIVNPGHEFGYRDFPDVQMQSVIWLCKKILSRHKIPAHNVVGHSDVAPERKEDPGEKFDWKMLAKKGVGLYYKDPVDHSGRSKWFFGKSRQIKAALNDLPFYNEVQANLAKYGYNCPQTGELDEQTYKIIVAFQRHFFPERLTGEWDHGCSFRLQALLDSIR